MRLRQLACVAAATCAVLLVATPAESQAPTLASIVAADNIFKTDSGGSPNVTIAAGGHVNFTYFTGNSRHNVVFTGALPTVCGISAGPAGTNAALPTQPAGPGWEGGCDFQTPGSYPFVCALHASMTGSVTVVGGGSAPPPPPPPPPASPPPPPPPAGELGPAASGLKVLTLQRGLSVRGTVKVARNGSRLLARAFARRKALYGGKSMLEVRVGRQLRSRVSATTVTFATSLTPIARRALRRNGRLAITLRLSVSQGGGEAYTATRTVILRAPL